MGVPQARERIFYIARRVDLNFAKLTLEFKSNPIYFGKIVDKNSTTHKPLWPSIIKRWPYVEYGDENLKFADARYRNLTTYNGFFSTSILYDHFVVPTLTSN